MGFSLAHLSLCVNGGGCLVSYFPRPLPRPDQAMDQSLCSHLSCSWYVCFTARNNALLTVSCGAHSLAEVVRQQSSALIKQRTLRCLQKDVGGAVINSSACSVFD